MKSVAFFFPSYKVGGVELLFSRLAIVLQSRGVEIEIIDYANGFLSSDLKSKGIPFKGTLFKEGNIIRVESDICICSLVYLVKVRNCFRPESRVFFWDDHPYNVLLFFKGIRLLRWMSIKMFKSFLVSTQYRKLLFCKKLIKNALRDNGLVFMCQYNYTTNKNIFDLEVTPNYLPIPVSSKAFHRITPNDKVINCSYIGRLDADKSNIVYDLIRDVVNFNLNNRISLRLNIIGDGNDRKRIETLFINQSEWIAFHGTIKGKQLDEFLIKNIDLSFAVGTSALESTALAIPTLVLRSPSFNIVKNVYMWLYQLESFDLSINKLYLSNSKDSIMSLEHAVNCFHHNYDKVSIHCFDYVNDNHNLEVVATKLVDYLKMSKLTVSELIG